MIKIVVLYVHVEFMMEVVNGKHLVLFEFIMFEVVEMRRNLIVIAVEAEVKVKCPFCYWVVSGEVFIGSTFIYHDLKYLTNPLHTILNSSLTLVD